MKIIINGIKIDKEIKTFKIEVNDRNYIIIRKKLDLEYEKILKYLKKLKEEGYIKSIKRPKNRELKNQLKQLVNAKKEIKKSINQIKEIFYK